jgi:hypothetical protein
MKTKFFIPLLAFAFASCDGGGDAKTNYVSDEPVTYTTSCSDCGGNGVILNPFDGEYYYCQTCRGTGTVTKTTSNPSFKGSSKACTATVGCDCSGFQKSGAYSPEQFICRKCGHQKQFHHKGDL